MVTLNGKMIYFCSVCGCKCLSNVIAVSKKTRKNTRGRIAWYRDAICPKCLKNERRADNDRQ